MRLLFVADGERDRVAVPKIVEGVLDSEIHCSFKPWKSIRLNRGRGYYAKLRYTVRQARDQQLDGVVATLDSDRAKPGKQLEKLKQARSDDRNNPTLTPFPTAVGEAVPHLEAWLLDDQVAVRDVLELPTSEQIPTPTRCDPKSILGNLINECPRIESPIELLGKIAASLHLQRCPHSSDTGLENFAREVHDEFHELAG